MLRGIGYMHGQKVAHLDIKADNIMRDSSGLNIYIIDFGCAKFFKDVNFSDLAMAEFQRKCWLDITGIERVLREILTKKVYLKVEQENNDTRKLMSRGNSTLKKTSDLLHGRGDVNRHFLEFINYLEENKDEKVSIIQVQERFREIQELCDGFTKEFSIS